jgi:hypothetical protein
MKNWEMLLVVRTPDQVTSEDRQEYAKHLAVTLVHQLPPEERCEIIRSLSLT